MWLRDPGKARVRTTMFKLRTLIRTFSPRLVGLGSSQAGVRGGREGAWEHFFAFPRRAWAVVGPSGPLSAARKVARDRALFSAP